MVFYRYLIFLSFFLSFFLSYSMSLVLSPSIYFYFSYLRSLTIFLSLILNLSLSHSFSPFSLYYSLCFSLSYCHSFSLLQSFFCFSFSHSLSHCQSILLSLSLSLRVFRHFLFHSFSLSTFLFFYLSFLFYLLPPVSLSLSLPVFLTFSSSLSRFPTFSLIACLILSPFLSRIQSFSFRFFYTFRFS
ncbi:unnamed protein product [Acanthosepion pharaonis]|uniref:Uncharacterized protein n=1 Tax=Acanthosepion pharaonis TaxID=158019 RepID=A0A812CSK4_ACAPH|nr:unnamed protein product [Sepia pharaonis]